MDVEQINNIMTNGEREEASFSDAQWLYLPDVNQGSYQNILQFYTTPLKQQFIDYHNAYLRIPFSLEFLLGAPTGPDAGGALSVANHPPMAALRQSVLNLFTNINISTDQGQTIVNDLNTQFINNIRLEVENDEGWMRSDGPMLDYAYDRTRMFPSQFVAASTAGYNTAYQTAPRFTAFEGIELGNLANAPLTNDGQEFGNNTPANALFITSGQYAVTSIAGVSLTGAANNYLVPFTFADGRVANFAVSTSAPSTISEFGGVLATSPAGTYQADGFTNVLDNPYYGELVTTPVVTDGVHIISIGNFLLNGTAATTGTASAYGQISGYNPNSNLGFMDRVTLLQNSAEYQYVAGGAGVLTPAGQTNAYGAHIYYYRAIVPLKLLHDFFRQLDFPIINVGFNFQFTFAQQHGANPLYTYPPIQTSNNTYLITGGQDVTPYPSIWYGREAGSQQGTRLYYRVVKFSPADNARMAEKLTTGFTKSIKFISCDWFREPLPVATGTTTHQFQFSTSVVHPLRVWVQPYPVITYPAGLAGQVVTNVGPREALADPTFAPGVVTGYFSQTNILINNVPYFRQNFSSVDDLWEQLREQFDPDNGSMISYVDFRTYKRTACYDLTRISDRLQSPTEPVNLTFIGQRADGFPYPLQMYYLTERLNQCTFRFSSSDVAIVVGNLD